MRCFKSIYTAPVAAIIVIRKLRRGTIAPIGRHNARVGYPQVDGQYHILKLSGLNLYVILHSGNCHRSCTRLNALKGYFCNINKVWAICALIQIAACAVPSTCSPAIIKLQVVIVPAFLLVKTISIIIVPRRR